MIDDRLVHRAKDAVGNVGWTGNLEEVAACVQHDSLSLPREERIANSKPSPLVHFGRAARRSTQRPRQAHRSLQASDFTLQTSEVEEAMTSAI
jgi:hypothetical protein